MTCLETKKKENNACVTSLGHITVKTNVILFFNWKLNVILGQ